ncbi:hypothetical protein Tco_0821715 [Tanacetum coccineum]|uniref:Uncharacterized protein n=1 Tax=Tanacetum coccineum TaxID=301880 RepID=A0ABQ5AD04_9ASTR
MIKNGGNGSFRVVFPLVRLVSLLWGFNSLRLCFLNFSNDLRIIKEQRIAAYNGYRRGGMNNDETTQDEKEPMKDDDDDIGDLEDYLIQKDPPYYELTKQDDEFGVLVFWNSMCLEFFWNKEYRGLNSSDGGYYKRLIQFAGGGDFSEEFKRTASDKAGR